MTLGQTIRSARLKLGLTLRDVGTRLGVSIVYLSDIERGLRELPAFRVPEIAAVLGLDADKLMDAACTGHQGNAKALVRHQQKKIRELEQRVRQLEEERLTRPMNGRRLPVEG